MPGDNVLRLITLRSHDQYNTTIYALDDRYRGVFGRRDVLFMCDDDLNRLGLQHGQVALFNCTAILFVPAPERSGAQSKGGGLM